MKQLFTLEDKHILVTGASAGIGRAICVMAAQLGAHLSLVARRENKLKETLAQMEGKGHQYFLCDLAKTDTIEPLVKDIVAAQGPLDGMMHCAGTVDARPLALMERTQVEALMSIHFYAFVELLRACSKKKHVRPGASFLGTSSVAATTGGKGQGSYAAAKGAVEASIGPFAKELAAKNIRLNAIAYGMIDTDMYHAGFLDIGGDNEDLLKTQYLGVGTPQDAAASACFLLSDTAKFITGTTMVVDGGTLS